MSPEPAHDSPQAQCRRLSQRVQDCRSPTSRTTTVWKIPVSDLEQAGLQPTVVHPAFSQAPIAADPDHSGPTVLELVRSDRFGRLRCRARRGSGRRRARAAAGRGRTLAGDRRGARAGARPRRPRTEGADAARCTPTVSTVERHRRELAATLPPSLRSFAPRRCVIRRRCRRCTTCASKTGVGGISGVDGSQTRGRTGPRIEVNASVGASPAGTTSDGAYMRTAPTAGAGARDRGTRARRRSEAPRSRTTRRDRYCSR